MDELQFYTTHEEYGDKFFRVPKVFMTNPIYKGLSNDAKMAWAILRDRHELSIKNGWFDENGRIFFIYSNEKLEPILGLSKNTVTKVKKELKKAKLLHPVRQGQGKPDKLYLVKPVLRDEDIYLIKRLVDETESPEGKKHDESQNHKNWDSESKTVGGVGKHKNWDSKGTKIGKLKSQILTPIETNGIKTDFSQTEYFVVNQGKQLTKFLIDICNNFYTTYAPGRWSKKQWVTLIQRYVEDFIKDERYKEVKEKNLHNYIESSIKMICHKHDLKYGKKEPMFMPGMEFANAPKEEDYDDLPF